MRTPIIPAKCIPMWHNSVCKTRKWTCHSFKRKFAWNVVLSRHTTQRRWMMWIIIFGQNIERVWSLSTSLPTAEFVPVELHYIGPVCRKSLDHYLLSELFVGFSTRSTGIFLHWMQNINESSRQRPFSAKFCWVNIRHQNLFESSLKFILPSVFNAKCLHI